jgi:hypothetical protein
MNIARIVVDQASKEKDGTNSDGTNQSTVVKRSE